MKKCNWISAPIFLLGCFVFISCDSSETSRNLLTDANGDPVANQNVQLLQLDDSGNTLSSLESTTSTTSGEFSFKRSRNTDASVVVTTTSGSTTYRAFWAGSSKRVLVNPVTSALVDTILSITGSKGERSLSDFSNEELKSINDSIENADLGSLNQNEPSLIRSFLIKNTGRIVAEASGALISSVSEDSLEASTSNTTAQFTSNTGVCDNLSYFGFSSGAISPKIREDGTLCRAVSNEGQGFFSIISHKLNLANEIFEAHGGSDFVVSPFIENTNTFSVKNNLEIVLGPQKLSGKPIYVERRIYYSPEQSFVRYADVFKNEGAEDIDLQVDLKTFLDITGRLLTFDLKSNQTEPSVSSRFVSVYDTFVNGLAASFIFQSTPEDVTALLTNLEFPSTQNQLINLFSSTWGSIKIPANDQKILVSYVLFHSSTVEATVEKEATDFIDSPDLSLFSVKELSQIANIRVDKGTLQGEAGSVFGRMEVKAVQIDANDMEIANGKTIHSKSDGSFFIPLAVKSGDRVKIQAEDGLNIIRQVE